MTVHQLTLDGVNERHFQRLANNAVHHSGEVGVPYQSGSATSKAAAEKIAPKVSRLEGYVLDALHRHPDGLTDEQIDFVYNDHPIGTLRPRRIALTQMKLDRKTGAFIRPALVEDSGETRLTRFGNKAAVWKLSAHGRAVAEDRARQ